MKPFDLEAAKAGAKVVADAGWDVRIIAYDRKGDDRPLVALVRTAAGTEELLSYSADGTCPTRLGTQYNLRMAPVVREGWVNVYPASTVGSMGSLWGTREKADKAAMESRITCVRIEWAE